jgi:hypothetical protein
MERTRATCLRSHVTDGEHWHIGCSIQSMPYVIRRASDRSWLAVFRTLESVLCAAAAMSGDSDEGAFFVYEGLETAFPIAIAFDGRVRLTGAMAAS